MSNFLTEEQIKVLKLTHKTIKDKKLADRIKVILMLHFGFTYSQISQALILDKVTLHRYIEKFNQKGINGLLECRYTGGQSRLTSIQEQELKAFLVVNTQTKAKERLNLNGALNLTKHTALVLEEKTINFKATIKLFKRLEKHHSKGKIYLILDNASHHHAKKVKLWLKKHRRLKTVFLPSYSPNLNLIERLWRFFHQKITNNHYFETFDKFRKTSLKFFRNLDFYKEELSTLLTDNFQLVPNLQLQT